MPKNCQPNREVAEALSILLGKKVTGIRVGCDGFDLVFDDGTELEVYVFTAKIRRVKRCIWGVLITRYMWHPVPDRETASRIVEELTKHGIDATIVATYDGKLYVGVAEDHEETLTKLCPQLSPETRHYICKGIDNNQ